MTSTTANTERFARLLGPELKVALQLHLDPNTSPLDTKTETLIENARSEGLTFEKDGKFQIFVRAIMQARGDLDSVLSSGQASVLFPGDDLAIVERSKLVFRRKVRFNGRRSSVVPRKPIWMRAARFGKRENNSCIMAFSAPGASDPQKEFFSPIFTAPFIDNPSDFEPVYIKVLIEDAHRYFRIDAFLQEGDVLVSLQEVDEVKAPSYLKLEKSITF
jgi:hypothetical protein